MWTDHPTIAVGQNVEIRGRHRHPKLCDSGRTHREIHPVDCPRTRVCECYIHCAPRGRNDLGANAVPLHTGQPVVAIHQVPLSRSAENVVVGVVRSGSTRMSSTVTPWPPSAAAKAGSSWLSRSTVIPRAPRLRANAAM